MYSFSLVQIEDIEELAMKSFSPLDQTKAHERVAQHIMRAIQLGRFLPGERLPAERKLADQLGVSRTVLRQASALLESDGYIKVQRGAKGGMIVLNHAQANRSDHLELSQRIEELEHTYEFRAINEGMSAKLAAARRTNNDLTVMKGLLQRMDQLIEDSHKTNDAELVGRFLVADTDFHRAIAEASRNPHIIKAIEDTLALRFVAIGGIFKQIHPNANHWHREIVASIESRDGDAAEVLMKSHINETLEATRALTVAVDSNVP